jgi:hypothetical protein
MLSAAATNMLLIGAVFGADGASCLSTEGLCSAGCYRLSTLSKDLCAAALLIQQLDQP